MNILSKLYACKCAGYSYYYDSLCIVLTHSVCEEMEGEGENEEEEVRGDGGGRGGGGGGERLKFQTS